MTVALPTFCCLKAYYYICQVISRKKSYEVYVCILCTSCLIIFLLSDSPLLTTSASATTSYYQAIQANYTKSEIVKVAIFLVHPLFLPFVFFSVLVKMLYKLLENSALWKMHGRQWHNTVFFPWSLKKNSQRRKRKIESEW